MHLAETIRFSNICNVSSLTCLRLSTDYSNLFLRIVGFGKPASFSFCNGDAILTTIDSVFMFSVPNAINSFVDVDLRKNMFSKRNLKDLAEF